MKRRATYLAVIAFWTLFVVANAFQIWVSMITHGHSLVRIVGFQAALWYAWLLLTPFIVWLGRKACVIPPNRVNILLHVMTASLIGVVHTAYWVGITLWIRPYDAMGIRTFMDPFVRFAFYNLPCEIILYLLVLGGSYAVEYYSKYREREVRAAHLERSLSEARLHALELQIQPHFLFNTLNAVSSLVRNRQPDDAIAMIAGLSDLLRYTLDHAGDQRVPVEQEIAILRRYLEIQRARFPDRLSFDIEVDDDVRLAAIPVLILQPLAENAIRHGVARSAGAGRVEVRAFRDDSMLRLEMFNTGSFVEAAPQGIGLRNTVERLRQLYGESQRFVLRNVAGGVLASVEIPWSVVA